MVTRGSLLTCELLQPSQDRFCTRRWMSSTCCFGPEAQVRAKKRKPNIQRNGWIMLLRQGGLGRVLDEIAFFTEDYRCGDWPT